MIDTEAAEDIDQDQDHSHQSITRNIEEIIDQGQEMISMINTDMREVREVREMREERNQIQERTMKT